MSVLFVDTDTAEMKRERIGYAPKFVSTRWIRTSHMIATIVLFDWDVALSIFGGIQILNHQGLDGKRNR